MLPCITKAIVNDFSEIISDDEMETLNVAFPNKGQRRHLSPSEEAAEIEMIRPILYKIYEHEKAAGNVQGKFRTFFAEVLGMSETTLQRKESISKVSEKIKEAVDAGHIKPTAAAALANMGAEEQNHIVQSIKDKGKEVTVEAVKQAKIFFDQSEKNYYAPVKDEIHVLPREKFKSLDAFYATCAHEIAHSTGHESRVQRDIVR